MFIIPKGLFWGVYTKNQMVIKTPIIRPDNMYLRLGVDGWITLGWISRRWDVGIWTGLAWPRIETGDGRL